MFNHLAGMLYYDGMYVLSLVRLSSDNLGTSASLRFFRLRNVSKRLIQITQVLCLSFSFWQRKGYLFLTCLVVSNIRQYFFQDGGSFFILFVSILDSTTDSLDVMECYDGAI